MYDELVKRLREKAGAFDYDGRPDIACDYEQAADAIEELTAIREEQKAQIIIMAGEIEEYKAAYRKEHNKRIAENRYLYDELTKTVRAKLLMTPMRIEVAEPPKEERA